MANLMSKAWLLDRKCQVSRPWKTVDPRLHRSRPRVDGHISLCDRAQLRIIKHPGSAGSRVGIERFVLERVSGQ